MFDSVKRGSRRNFFIVDNGIFDERLELSSLDKLVYICLLRYADNNSKECFPAMQTIAEDCCISRKRVNQAVKVLEQKKLLIKKQRFDKSGSKKSNLYIIYDANEVINTMYPQVTTHVTSGDNPCNLGLHTHVTSGDKNYTHLKILSEEESLNIDEKDKRTVKVDFKLLKGLVKG